MKTRPAIERFFDKVEITDTCWLWTAKRFHDGYGSFYLSPTERTARAHRVAYELLVGPIPEGLVLEHVVERGCTHRHCVNPDHLEPVTPRENTLRGESLQAANADKDCCDSGHEFTPENTYIRTNGQGRDCRACGRERRRRYLAKRAAA